MILQQELKYVFNHIFIFCLYEQCSISRWPEITKKKNHQSIIVVGLFVFEITENAEESCIHASLWVWLA